MAHRTINIESLRLNGLQFRVFQEKAKSKDPARISKASVLDRILDDAGIIRMSEQELKQRSRGMEVIAK